MTETSVPLLRTEGLRRTFGSLVAVNDVNLRIPEGEVHSIIGPNGAGKTTLFNMIAGSLEPSEGRIFFRGEDITDTAEHERARQGLSRAFQITQLFPDLSVRENLRLAVQAQDQALNPLSRPDPEHVRAAEETLSQLGIDVDPSVTAETLSHGDKKKLEIGMSLAADPSLLLLDEPTSGVAQAESSELMEFLSETSHGRTVVLIEHNVDLVLELSDRISVLHRGSVIAQGTPDEITENERVQEAYMGGY